MYHSEPIQSGVPKTPRSYFVDPLDTSDSWLEAQEQGQAGPLAAASQTAIRPKDEDNWGTYRTKETLLEM